MPAVLERPIPSLDALREAVSLRREIEQLEQKLHDLFDGRTTRNSYGFSAPEMDRIGAKLHARAKKHIGSGKSKTLIGSIDEVL
jgi:hypothetical protein